MNPPVARAVWVRSAELILKGKNRRHFERQLLDNIRQSLGEKHPFHWQRIGASFLLTFEEAVDLPLMAHLQKVIGIAALAPVYEVPPNINVLTEIICETAPQDFAGSFAVETRRSFKKFSLNSQQINVLLGAAIQKRFAWPVDLDNPTHRLQVLIAESQAYFSWEDYRGLAGLPVGVSGKVLVLISGGIDSPVAAYRMARRGCRPYYVHFHSAPYTSQASIAKVKEVVQLLSEYHYATNLYLVPFADVQKEIVVKCPAPLRVILYRRFMLRIAEQLARKERALALVTGESVGQVASQTLSNIRSIEAVTTLPILRPLIGEDKQTIVDQARAIGTYPISIQPDEDCCSYLMPLRPATHSRRFELERAEADLASDTLIGEALQKTERH